MSWLKRALFHLRKRNEKTVLAVYYNFLDSPNLARNNRSFTRHGFEINDAKRFIDRWTTENRRVRVKLNDARFIEHLVDPDYAIARAPCLLPRALHFLSAFQRVARARATHYLTILINHLNRVDKMSHALLARGPR